MNVCKNCGVEITNHGNRISLMPHTSWEWHLDDNEKFGCNWPAGLWIDGVKKYAEPEEEASDSEILSQDR